MKNDMAPLNFIKDNFNFVKDMAMVLGMCGVLYLNLNYVTNTKFESFVQANEGRMDGIQAAIASLDKSLALLQQNNTMLTTLQVNVANITTVLNDVVQQNKEDAAVSVEFHKLAEKVTIVDKTVAAISLTDLAQHIKDEMKQLNDIDTRLKIIEIKTK